MEVQLPVDNTATMTNNGQRVGDSFYSNYSPQLRHPAADVSRNQASMSVPSLGTFSFEEELSTSQQFPQFSQEPDFQQQSQHLQYSNRPQNDPTPKISVHPVQPLEGRTPTSVPPGLRPQLPSSQYIPNKSIPQRSRLIIGMFIILL
ncbi:hypothetical protein C2G38_228319 [Gigaspora rosea]|uniref:Uncharacterized protein n=1 Tax=Gigaspora rosea TaxID=44941 RepID=A0A397UI32_9GLOM|nr:hypothetical protein C2G38_228319 [Gigaspora rosea]